MQKPMRSLEWKHAAPWSCLEIGVYSALLSPASYLLRQRRQFQQEDLHQQAPIPPIEGRSQLLFFWNDNSFTPRDEQWSTSRCRWAVLQVNLSKLWEIVTSKKASEILQLQLLLYNECCLWHMRSMAMNANLLDHLPSSMHSASHNFHVNPAAKLQYLVHPWTPWWSLPFLQHLEFQS